MHNLLVNMHNLAWDGELPLGVVGDIHNSAIANGACHCSYEIRQSTAFDYETNKISLSQNDSLSTEVETFEIGVHIDVGALSPNMVEQGLASVTGCFLSSGGVTGCLLRTAGATEGSRAASRPGLDQLCEEPTSCKVSVCSRQCQPCPDQSLSDQRLPMFSDSASVSSADTP